MPLINNKVGDDCTVGTDKALADGKALVDSLIKVSCSLFLTFFIYAVSVDIKNAVVQLCSIVTFITVVSVCCLFSNELSRCRLPPNTSLKMLCQKTPMRLI